MKEFTTKRYNILIVFLQDYTVAIIPPFTCNDSPFTKHTKYIIKLHITNWQIRLTSIPKGSNHIVFSHKRHSLSMYFINTIHQPQTLLKFCGIASQTTWLDHMCLCHDQNHWSCELHLIHLWPQMLSKTYLGNLLGWVNLAH